MVIQINKKETSLNYAYTVRHLPRLKHNHRTLLQTHLPPQLHRHMASQKEVLSLLPPIANLWLENILCIMQMALFRLLVCLCHQIYKKYSSKMRHLLKQIKIQRGKQSSRTSSQIKIIKYNYCLS